MSFRAEWLVPALLLLAALVVALRSRPRRGDRLCRDTGRHYRRLYSRRALLRLGGAVVAAGALVYSGADSAVDRWHTERVRSPATDAAARRLRYFGGRMWFLFWGVFAAADAAWRSTPLSRWGRRNWEAMLVGLPTLWALQYGLGAPRPSDRDGTASPRWQGPLRDQRSASGHAFMSAIPWLTLARRAPWPAAQAGAYAGSVLTGWSRVNDRMHFLSQVWLGWFAAWTAVAAVDAVERDDQRTRLSLPDPDPSRDCSR